MEHIAPWRITFDTNPDTCNLHCIMCEEHSMYSSLYKSRIAEKRIPRLMPFEIIEKVAASGFFMGTPNILYSS